jgi:hypothetical protein
MRARDQPDEGQVADTENSPRAEERMSHAEHALEAYRERRRRRRGEDTWFGSNACLIEAVEHGVDADEIGRRRSEVLHTAEEDGMPCELAELLYDIAREEGLDPALGYELVRCGLGVMPPPGGVDNAPEHETTDKYRPEWLLPAVDPDTQLRERTLRMSFRRLRSLLERHDDPAEAFRAFAGEPDVDAVGY